MSELLDSNGMKATNVLLAVFHIMLLFKKNNNNNHSIHFVVSDCMTGAFSEIGPNLQTNIPLVFALFQ